MDAKRLGQQSANPMPIAVTADGNTVSTGNDLHPDWHGLTKREAFAMAVSFEEAQCLVGDSIKDAAGFLGIPEASYRGADHYLAAISKAKVMSADALLAELAKDQP